MSGDLIGLCLYIHGRMSYKMMGLSTINEMSLKFCSISITVSLQPLPNKQPDELNRNIIITILNFKKEMLKDVSPSYGRHDHGPTVTRSGRVSKPPERFGETEEDLKILRLNYFEKVGRRGVMDKSVNYLSARRQGSADRIPVVTFILFVNVPRANSSEEMRVVRNRWSILARRKAGAATKRKDRQAFQEWI